jgi:hypothetical protein
VHDFFHCNDIENDEPRSRQRSDIPLTELLRPLRESFNQLRNSCDGEASSTRVAGFAAGCAGRKETGPLEWETAEAVAPPGRVDELAAKTRFDLPFGPTVVQALPEVGGAGGWV